MFMKTYRILGILWLALCSFMAFLLIWRLCQLIGFELTKFRPTLLFFKVLFMGLIYLAGVIVSIFLIRGARWARSFLGLFAVFNAILVIWSVVDDRPFSICWADGLGLFALVSAVLLFWPRHEPVA